VNACAPGYFAAVYPDPVTVVAGQVTANINFSLSPKTGLGRYGVIAGAVTDAGTGAVLRRAAVTAAGPAGTWTVLQCTTGYRIGHLPAGKYWVSAMAPGHVEGAYGDSVTVVGGAVTDSVSFSLNPEAEAFVLHKYGVIAGRVTDAVSGNVIRRAFITVTGPSGTRSVEQCTTGYRVGQLLPGSYEVSATAVGYASGVYPAPVTVVAGQTTGGIEFSLTPSGEADGSFGAEGVSGALASSTQLLAVSPNPARSGTRISYTLPQAGTASIRLYDASGRPVRTLVVGQFDRGTHVCVLNSSGLARGVDMLKLEAGNLHSAQKLILR